MSTTEQIRVLLVDDHAVVRSGLAAFLMAYDEFELVGEAGGGSEAIRLCEALATRCGAHGSGDGRTWAAWRPLGPFTDRWPHIQVIALTSFKEDELVQGVLQAGAISYLLKNVGADELADAIRKAYGGRPTLAPEAAQALIHAATQPPPLGHDLTAAGT